MSRNSNKELELKKLQNVERRVDKDAEMLFADLNEDMRSLILGSEPSTSVYLPEQVPHQEEGAMTTPEELLNITEHLTDIELEGFECRLQQGEIPDHKNQEFVPLREQCEGKKAELGKTEAEIHQMTQKRQQKIQQIKESVKMSKGIADRQKAEGVQVFTALKESVDRGLKELIEEIEDKQEATEKQAEGLIKDLEQEISELMKRSSEVEQLSHSAPPTKDWTEVSVCPPSYEGTVMKALAQLEETLRKLMKKFLKNFEQYAVDVTLDADTAHPNLILSDDGKQVYCGDVKRKLPNNPVRFSQCAGLLGKQSFFSGRFYFEVQVKGKTEWTLGVARESINRKGEITLCPQNGFWTVWLRNRNEYSACAGPPVPLCLQSGPEMVGVFVDYEEGLVSFYDVGAAALIHSFTGCSFNHKLHPFFSPCLNHGGKNSAPLIICPVNQTESINN